MKMIQAVFGGVNMKKHIALLLILCTCLLAACQQVQPPATDSGGRGSTPVQTTGAPSPTTKPSTVPTQPTEPTEPIDEELAKFNALFGELGSWYNKALDYEYTTPTETMDWEIFSGAFRDESNQISDSEISELKAMYPESVEAIENLDIHRLPVDRINQVLTQLFGITLADMDDSVVSGLPYIERTDCYYLIGGGVGGVMNFNALSVEHQEDGTIRLTYTQDCWRGDATMYVVTLMPYGDSYRILSNLPLE